EPHRRGAETRRRPWAFRPFASRRWHSVASVTSVVRAFHRRVERKRATCWQPRSNLSRGRARGGCAVLPPPLRFRTSGFSQNGLKPELSENKQVRSKLVAATGRIVVKVFLSAEKLDTFAQKFPLSDDYCGG